MKKILLGTVALAALGMAAPASAADLAARPYTKAPPPMVSPIYDWSGFYIGINGGGGSSHKCWDLVTTPTGVPLTAAEGCHDATGGTVGGQIGYRWQASNWVFGLEGQGNWADFKGSNSSLFFVDTNQSKIDAFGLITGQVGYAWNNALFYVKGGGAVVGDKYQTSCRLPAQRSSPLLTTRVGAARLALVSSSASLRTGRSAWSMITCSWAIATSTSPRRAACSPARTASVRTSIWASFV